MLIYIPNANSYLLKMTSLLFDTDSFDSMTSETDSASVTNPTFVN
jgi:hypothetical protein